MGKSRSPEIKRALRGTLRRDRQWRDPAARLREIPDPPAELSPGAVAQWQRLAPIVVALGTVTIADMPALALLCEVLGTESEARKIVGDKGMTVSTSDGGSKANPALKAMEVARNQATRLLAEFGLTPRGRSTVDAKPLRPSLENDDIEPVNDPDEPDLDAYLASRPGVGAPAQSTKRRGT